MNWHSFRNLLASCLQVERSQIVFGCGIRTSLTMVVVLAIALHSGNLTLGVPVALGVLLTNLSDMTEPPWLRWRTMLLTALACGFATLLGGLVSGDGVTHLVVAIVAAAAVGYAGALGPKGSLVGVFCLALFSLYAGSEIGSEAAVMDAAAIVVGGLIATLSAMLDGPFHRFGATRRKIAVAYRKFAEVCERPQANWSGLGAAAAILDATRSVDISGAAGPTEHWLRQLLACLERSRIVIFALAPRRQLAADRAQDPEAFDRVFTSAAALIYGIADALTARHRVSRLPALLGSLHAACDAQAKADLLDAALVSRLRAALDEAARLVIGPWPVGKVASCAPVAARGPRWRDSLRQHWHAGDIFIRHGRQMAITYGLATAVSLAPWNGFFLGHAYWIPLTVAWICKPDLAGTVSKVSMRLTGTLVGALLAVVCLSAVSQPDTAILFVGLGALVTCVFMWANYTVVVAAITVLVLGIGELAGSSVEPLAAVRVLATVLGAALVLLTALIQPLRSGVAVPAQLARLCADLRRYASALHDGKTELAPLRQALLQNRTALSISVAAAASEPSALWEKGRVNVDATLARTLLDALEATLSSLVASDLLGQPLSTRGPSLAQVDASIAAIEHRLPEVTRPPGTPS